MKVMFQTMKNKKSSLVLLLKKLALSNRLRHSKNKACFAIWIVRSKSFLKSDSNVGVNASEEEEESNEESSNKESCPQKPSKHPCPFYMGIPGVYGW